MNYPRTVILAHPRLISSETQKGQIIAEGRQINEEIANIELEMGKLDIRLQAEEAKIDIKDLKAKGDRLVEELQKIGTDYANKIKAIEQEIFDRMAANTNPEFREQHQALVKKKEELETERNKKALKAQKIKDRIIPIARRLLSKHLQNKYEDFYDIQLKDGVMVGTIFSHLDEWDKKYNEKLKKQEQAK